MNSGLSKARLSRMHDVMAGHVERGNAPGLVTMLSRHGEVHVDPIGVKTLGDNDAMQRDTIFRIASMTKPITAVAALMLIEECKLRLDEPLDALLPELTKLQVLKRVDGPLDATLPMQRPITLRDLLTFRLGTGMVVAPPNTLPIQKALNAAGLAGPPKPRLLPTPDEWMHRLSALPLLHQPGETWMYNTGSDVLGVLIARVTGRSLGTFFQDRIFGPLGMKDTAFSVPAEKLSRLPTSYEVDPQSKALAVYDDIEHSQWREPPAFDSGSGGLVSTADDCLTFARMLLNKGKHGNTRLLSRPSVETMITDQLTPEQKRNSDFVPGFFDARGWGFGVCVITQRDDLSSVPGRFGWDGGLGTSCWMDPQEDLVGILLTQRAGFPMASPVYQDFWTSTYQAIDD